MIAALGMYDMPAVRSANDRFWLLIRENLGFGPTSLTRDEDAWNIWQSPDLLFAQTCGMPYRTRLHGKVQLVGTPDYGLPGCPPGHYRSVFVARQDDPRGLKELASGTFAYNEALSQSGWAAPMVHLAKDARFPSELLMTGGHAYSAQAVADGRAEYACLDAVTWALLKKHTNLGTALRAVEETSPTPALPFITAIGQDAAAIARATQKAITELSDQDAKLLLLRNLVAIPADDYLAVPNAPQAAAEMLNP